MRRIMSAREKGKKRGTNRIEKGWEILKRRKKHDQMTRTINYEKMKKRGKWTEHSENKKKQ